MAFNFFLHSTVEDLSSKEDTESICWTLTVSLQFAHQQCTRGIKCNLQNWKIRQGRIAWVE